MGERLRRFIDMVSINATKPHPQAAGIDVMLHRTVAHSMRAFGADDVKRRRFGKEINFNIWEFDRISINQ